MARKGLDAIESETRDGDLRGGSVELLTLAANDTARKGKGDERQPISLAGATVVEGAEIARAIYRRGSRPGKEGVLGADSLAPDSVLLGAAEFSGLEAFFGDRNFSVFSRSRPREAL
jgi:hypothetical protein